MSRKNRIKSRTGVYHIISRGVGKQNIFYDKNDYIKYFSIMKETKEKIPYKILAFCFMGNHVHLMLRDENDEISKIIQIVNLRYASYFNYKYNRCGHLFQDRFTSEAVETQDYFYQLIPYIHLNPVRAGLSLCMEEYPYSSYQSYFGSAWMHMEIDTDEVLQYIEMENLYRIHLDYATRKIKSSQMFGYKRHSENDALQLICNYLDNSNPNSFLQKTKQEQISLLREFVKENITLKQISRITGISYERIKYLNQKLKQIPHKEPSLAES